jgi:hypothetical protein
VLILRANSADNFHEKWVFKAGNAVFRIWKQSVLAYWKHSFLEFLRKTAGTLQKCSDVISIFRNGKSPNMSLEIYHYNKLFSLHEYLPDLQTVHMYVSVQM